MNNLRRTESKKSVFEKFSLETTKSASFIYKDGIPHRMKNGVLTPLTKVIK
jgi:hypothetical protein